MKVTKDMLIGEMLQMDRGIGVILMAFNPPLPTFVSSTITYLSRCTIPLSMLIIGFIIGYKYYYKNSIKEFYELLTLTKKITIKILKPPFIAMIYKAIKNHKAKKIYYKKHPYLKKNKYELFLNKYNRFAQS